MMTIAIIVMVVIIMMIILITSIMIIHVINMIIVMMIMSANKKTPKSSRQYIWFLIFLFVFVVVVVTDVIIIIHVQCLTEVSGQNSTIIRFLIINKTTLSKTDQFKNYWVLLMWFSQFLKNCVLFDLPSNSQRALLTDMKWIITVRVNKHIIFRNCIISFASRTVRHAARHLLFSVSF